VDRASGNPVRRISGLVAAAGWDSRRVRRSLAARTHRVCGLPSHGVPLALIATVAAGQCRTTDLYRLGGHSGSARGGKHDCAVAKPQVTDPGLRRVKFVRMFEFMPLNSAPGRIRTCAHGPGEGLLCTPLTSGNEFRHTRSGGVSGAVRPVLRRTDASAFRVGSGGHWPPCRGWPILSGR
jgi:hypothetical protein